MPPQASKNPPLGVRAGGNFARKVLILDALQCGEEAEPKPHRGLEASPSPYEACLGFQIPPPPWECSFVTLNP